MPKLADMASGAPLAGTELTYVELATSVAGDERRATVNDFKTYVLGDFSANALSLVSAADYAAMRALLDLEAGTDFNAYSANLAALSAQASTGLMVRTGAGTYTTRTLTGPAAGISVSNGDGISGNPTLALANDLAALEALSGTDTIYYRSGADTWSAVTIGSGVSFAAGTLSATGAGGTIGGSTGATDEAVLVADGVGGSTLQATPVTINSSTGAFTFPDDVRQTFNPGANNAGLNVGSVAGDPSTPSNGDVWYDSAANELTARINGANVALGASSISDFTDLGDVPASYTGHAGKVAAVKATEDGLEFIAAEDVTSAADGSFDAEYFGDGSDGNVTVSSGTTTLTRDMYYDNLTVDGTGTIDTAGWKIFVRGTLDLSAAPANAIRRNGVAGTNAASNIQGPGGAAVGSTGTLAGNSNGTAGSNGAAGGTGAGSQPTATAGSTSVGGLSGAGGAGGAVGGTAGGASRAAGSVTLNADLRRLATELTQFVSTTFLRIGGGVSAPGGSSGAGDGVGTGGPGGGGGSGAGVVFIAARTINRSGSTAAAAISARGGNGGNGASGAGGTNRGGGGGGAGGAGGWIYLIYRDLTGTTATGALDATGGTGGAGANGVGTGNGGNAGGGGGGGRIDVYDLGSGTQTITNTVAATTGNAASGGTGGAATSATAQTANL